VELMTIHKAKGLEFDTVIVPGLGREAAGDGRALLRWAEVATSDGTSLVFAPVEASREDESDPIYGYLGHLDRQRGRHENLRLLYVAATRARQRLHLLGAVEPAAKGGLKKPRAGSLLELLWPVVEEEFQAAFTASPLLPVAGAEDQHVPPPQWFHRLPPGWTQAYEPNAAAHQDVSGEVTFDWVGDMLRHAGTVAHVWLDRVAREGPEAWNSRRLDAERPAIQAALEGYGLNAGQTAEAVLIVTRAIENTLRDPRGRWIVTAHPGAESEAAIATVDDVGMLRHLTVDRTFVDPGTGIRWIVDYKLSRHEGAGLDAFLDNEKERYRARLNSYAAAFRRMEALPVKVALYHPLVAGWREWDPD
jgi:ATP-dependent exoDNAse (exonuclease V) beta subunit